MDIGPADDSGRLKDSGRAVDSAADERAASEAQEERAASEAQEGEADLREVTEAPGAEHRVLNSIFSSTGEFLLCGGF